MTNQNLLRYNPKPHLLTFVDALGFHKEIQKSESQQIQEYLTVFSRLHESWEEREQKRKLKVTAIGDSVIIGVEVAAACRGDSFIPDSPSEFQTSLYHLCFAVAEFQCQLALKDIWTRGAVTFGKVDFDPGGGRLLGPAFHSAYKLESSVARYPRVILDGSIVRASGKDTTQELVTEVNGTNGGAAEQFPVLHDLRTSQGPAAFFQDVPTFIDFVAWASSSAGGASLLRTLSEHVLARLHGDVEHYEKYHWLRSHLINVISSRSPRADDSGVNLSLIFDRLELG